jgi:cell division topological specificity factor
VEVKVIGFLKNWFNPNNAGDTSKTVAKSRLHFVLVQDRSGMDQSVLAQFRQDMIEVIEKYFEVDKKQFDISYQREKDTTTLVINSPVAVRRALKAKKITKEPVTSAG